MEDDDRDGDDEDVEGGAGDTQADEDAGGELDEVLIAQVAPLAPLLVEEAAFLAEVPVGGPFEALPEGGGWFADGRFDCLKLLLISAPCFPALGVLIYES